MSLLAINSGTQANGLIFRVPLDIDERITEARRNPNFPIGNLIRYADMWFNLQDNPHVEMQLSPALKEQLLCAAGSYFDAAMIPNMAGFTVDELSIPDLVLLYRLLNSYYVQFPEPILSIHLDRIKDKLLEISKKGDALKTDVFTTISKTSFLRYPRKATL